MNYSDNTYILLLRTLQEYTGQSVGELAEQLGYSGAYLSMMIHKARGLTEPFKANLIALTDHYLGDGSSSVILLALGVIDTHLKSRW